MENSRKLAAFVALLAMLAGPVTGCAIAQVPAGIGSGACSGQMNHSCESALTAGTPLCCTVSPQENPYLAVRVNPPAPVTTAAHLAIAAAPVAIEEMGGVLSVERTLSPPGSPPSSISILRI